MLTLDDLFRRTKTEPALYWLPLRPAEPASAAADSAAEPAPDSAADPVPAPVAGTAASVEEESEAIAAA